MSESNNLVETEDSKSNLVDINDQNILDYDDEIDNNLNIQSNKEKPNQKTKEIEDDSDGEIKSENHSDNDLDDGEVPSPRYDRNANSSATDLKEDSDKQEKHESEEKDEEEDGEINDGEKTKKVFVPRVLCKYYQRGKCTWGRGCKFLHPGVNDTGNYNFLEFQDPNAAVFQQAAAKNMTESIDSSSARPIAQVGEAAPTESAWERGLRHAKEMKEKALRRKQIEGEQFADKKMNLSLKELETEKENDERYVNVERVATADDDLEDEDLNQFRYWRSKNQEKSDQHDEKISYRYNDHRDQRTFTRPIRQRGSISPERESKYNRQQKSDDWHDPWDRSKNKKKQASRDYNSSDSDSRSRSRSDSRSSYSSKSSSSYRSNSYSSRSNSRSPNRYSKNKKIDRQSRQRTDVKKTTQDKTDLTKNLKTKPLPGRQISDFSLKKAGLDSDKTGKKSRKNRSNSRSSTSSNDSYKSNDDDNDSDDDYSKDESGSDDDSDDEFSKNKKKSSKNKIKTPKKRSAQDSKGNSDAKKQKLSGQTVDKKQQIKDQLKLLESALKKKTSSK